MFESYAQRCVPAVKVFGSKTQGAAKVFRASWCADPGLGVPQGDFGRRGSAVPGLKVPQQGACQPLLASGSRAKNIFFHYTQLAFGWVDVQADWRRPTGHFGSRAWLLP